MSCLPIDNILSVGYNSIDNTKLLSKELVLFVKYKKDINEREL